MAGTRGNNSMVLLCFLFLATVPLLTSSSVLRTLHHASENDGSLRFLVIGDWGRRGDYNQSLVAAQMGRIAAEMRTEFVVSTGDNFYDNGLEGEADPAFLQSFTNVYTAPSLQTKWFLVLGNHDYRGDVLAQLAPSLRQIDRRWICMRSFIVNAEIAELFFVDTTPFVEDYVTGRDGHTYDWRGITPVKNYTSNLLEELESALKRSNASWKIVVGHHAIRSVGHHGDTTELIDQLLPILQANNVDLYLNGHDHCLERISDAKSPLQFMTSGAGSKAWRGDVKNMNEEGLKFFYDGQGFMSLHLTQTDARATFYDVFGRVLHTWHRSKELHTDF